VFIYAIEHFIICNFSTAPKEEPSLEYEMARRKVIDGVKEMWFFFSAEMKKLQKLAQNNPQIQTKISYILETGIEHKRYY